MGTVLSRIRNYINNESKQLVMLTRSITVYYSYIYNPYKMTCKRKEWHLKYILDAF